MGNGDEQITMAVTSTSAAGGTGINVPEIVSGLMDVERVPITKLQSKIDQQTLQITTLGVFKSKVSALESAARALTTPSIYALRQATSSDATKVSATASNAAAAATYAVKVAQTAQGETETLGGFQSASQIIDLNNFSLTVGVGADAVTYSPKYATLGATSSFSRNDRITMTLGGGQVQVFTVTDQTTPTAVAAAINQAVEDGDLTGVVASIDSATNRLVIDAENAIQGVTAQLEVPGYATFDAVGQTYAESDRILFTLSDGAQQSFTLGASHTSATTVASAINAAVSAGTLAGVLATVESGELRLSSTDAGKSLIASHLRGTTATNATVVSRDAPAVTVTDGGVGETNTLANLAASINALDAGIQASVVQSGVGQFSLHIASLQTGAENKIAISGISTSDRQKDRIALSGLFAVGDVVTVTLNDQSLTYQVTADDLTADGAGGAAVAGDSVTAYANISANLADAFNLSTRSGHDWITATANDDGSVDFVVDASDVGTAFTSSVSVSGAVATMSVVTENVVASPSVSAVSQVNELEIAGRYAAGDIVSITVNGLALNYTVSATDVADGGSSADDHNRIALALKAAFDASVATEHTAVTTTVSGGVVSFTAATPGTAFTASASPTVAASSVAAASVANVIANVENPGVLSVGAAAQAKKSGLTDLTVAVVFNGSSWQLEHQPEFPADCLVTFESGVITISSASLGGAAMTISDVVGTPKVGDRIAVELDAAGDAGPATLTEHASIELQTARDAFVSINGQSVQRSTNAIDDVIDGVTFNLNTPTDSASGTIESLAEANFSSGTTNATINVTAGAEDLSAVAIRDLVTAYNDLLSFYKTESVSSTDPNARGVLNGDSSLRTFMGRLRGLYAQGIQLADGANLSFTSIGVEFQRDGSLYINEGTLDAAVSNGLQEKLAAGVKIGVESPTLNFTSFLTKSLQIGGMIVGHIADVESEQARVQDRIDTLEEKMTRIEARLYKQYAALDALLFRLQTTSNALTSALDSLAANQNNN
jgi:flagellar capping protein FliD